jgi:hypothetical protein
MNRVPAVAGRFYDSDPERLSQQVAGFSIEVPEKARALGVVVPHAGLMYSGSVAGKVYSSITPPDTFLLIGPNHTGLGTRISIMEQGSWESPTGTLMIDSELAIDMMGRFSGLESDTEAHMIEHSLEVQLPFIVHHSPEARIVPIAILEASLETLLDLGRAIAESISSSPGSITIAASSDMSHFIPDALARKKDRMAIDRILALDPEGLLNVVRAENITMCGVLPTVTMLSAALALGATKAELLQYTTSAEVSGETESVVGYAGLVIT